MPTRNAGYIPRKRPADSGSTTTGDLSPEEEMVQDMTTVVRCFSRRLYGLRNYRKKLKEALDADRTPD